MVKHKWENGDLWAQKALSNFPTIGIIRTTDLKGNSGQVSSLKSHRGTGKVQEVQRGRKGTPQGGGSMHFYNLCLLDLVQFHLFEISWTFLGRNQIWHDMVKLIVYFDFSPLLKKSEQL